MDSTNFPPSNVKSIEEIIASNMQLIDTYASFITTSDEKYRKIKEKLFNVEVARYEKSFVEQVLSDNDKLRRAREKLLEICRPLAQQNLEYSKQIEALRKKYENSEKMCIAWKHAKDEMYLLFKNTLKELEEKTKKLEITEKSLSQFKKLKSLRKKKKSSIVEEKNESLDDTAVLNLSPVPNVDPNSVSKVGNKVFSHTLNNENYKVNSSDGSLNSTSDECNQHIFSSKFSSSVNKNVNNCDSTDLLDNSVNENDHSSKTSKSATPDNDFSHQNTKIDDYTDAFFDSVDDFNIILDEPESPPNLSTSNKCNFKLNEMSSAKSSYHQFNQTEFSTQKSSKPPSANLSNTSEIKSKLFETEYKSQDFITKPSNLESASHSSKHISNLGNGTSQQFCSKNTSISIDKEIGRKSIFDLDDFEKSDLSSPEKIKSPVQTSVSTPVNKSSRKEIVKSAQSSPTLTKEIKSSDLENDDLAAMIEQELCSLPEVNHPQSDKSEDEIISYRGRGKKYTKTKSRKASSNSKVTEKSKKITEDKKSKSPSFSDKHDNFACMDVKAKSKKWEKTIFDDSDPSDAEYDVKEKKIFPVKMESNVTNLVRSENQVDSMFDELNNLDLSSSDATRPKHKTSYQPNESELNEDNHLPPKSVIQEDLDLSDSSCPLSPMITGREGFISPIMSNWSDLSEIESVSSKSSPQKVSKTSPVPVKVKKKKEKIKKIQTKPKEVENSNELADISTEVVSSVEHDSQNSLPSPKAVSDIVEEKNESLDDTAVLNLSPVPNVDPNSVSKVDNEVLSRIPNNENYKVNSSDGSLNSTSDECNQHIFSSKFSSSETKNVNNCDSTDLLDNSVNDDDHSSKTSKSATTDSDFNHQNSKIDDYTDAFFDSVDDFNITLDKPESPPNLSTSNKCNFKLNEMSSAMSSLHQFNQTEFSKQKSSNSPSASLNNTSEIKSKLLETEYKSQDFITKPSNLESASHSNKPISNLGNGTSQQFCSKSTSISVDKEIGRKSIFDLDDFEKSDLSSPEKIKSPVQTSVSTPVNKSSRKEIVKSVESSPTLTKEIKSSALENQDLAAMVEQQLCSLPKVNNPQSDKSEDEIISYRGRGKKYTKTKSRKDSSNSEGTEKSKKIIEDKGSKSPSFSDKHDCFTSVDKEIGRKSIFDLDDFEKSDLSSLEKIKSPVQTFVSTPVNNSSRKEIVKSVESSPTLTKEIKSSALENQDLAAMVGQQLCSLPKVNNPQSDKSEDEIISYRGRGKKYTKTKSRKDSSNSEGTEKSKKITEDKESKSPSFSDKHDYSASVDKEIGRKSIFDLDVFEKSDLSSPEKIKSPVQTSVSTPVDKSSRKEIVKSVESSPTLTKEIKSSALENQDLAAMVEQQLCSLPKVDNPQSDKSEDEIISYRGRGKKYTKTKLRKDSTYSNGTEKSKKITEDKESKSPSFSDKHNYFASVDKEIERKSIFDLDDFEKYDLYSPEKIKSPVQTSISTPVNNSSRKEIVKSVESSPTLTKEIKSSALENLDLAAMVKQQLCSLPKVNHPQSDKSEDEIISYRGRGMKYTKIKSRKDSSNSEGTEKSKKITEEKESKSPSLSDEHDYFASVDKEIGRKSIFDLDDFEKSDLSSPEKIKSPVQTSISTPVNHSSRKEIVKSVESSPTLTKEIKSSALENQDLAAMVKQQLCSLPKVNHPQSDKSEDEILSYRGRGKKYTETKLRKDSTYSERTEKSKKITEDKEPKSPSLSDKHDYSVSVDKEIGRKSIFDLDDFEKSDVSSPEKIKSPVQTSVSTPVNKSPRKEFVKSVESSPTLTKEMKSSALENQDLAAMVEQQLCSLPKVNHPQSDKSEDEIISYRGRGMKYTKTKSRKDSSNSEGTEKSKKITENKGSRSPSFSDKQNYFACGDVKAVSKKWEKTIFDDSDPSDAENELNKKKISPQKMESNERDSIKIENQVDSVLDDRNSLDLSSSDATAPKNKTSYQPKESEINEDNHLPLKSVIQEDLNLSDSSCPPSPMKTGREGFISPIKSNWSDLSEIESISSKSSPQKASKTSPVSVKVKKKKEKIKKIQTKSKEVENSNELAGISTDVVSSVEHDSQNSFLSPKAVSDHFDRIMSSIHRELSEIKLLTPFCDNDLDSLEIHSNDNGDQLVSKFDGLSSKFEEVEKPSLCLNESLSADGYSKCKTIISPKKCVEMTQVKNNSECDVANETDLVNKLVDFSQPVNKMIQVVSNVESQVSSDRDPEKCALTKSVPAKKVVKRINSSVNQKPAVSLSDKLRTIRFRLKNQLSANKSVSLLAKQKALQRICKQPKNTSTSQENQSCVETKQVLTKNLSSTSKENLFSESVTSTDVSSSVLDSVMDEKVCFDSNSSVTFDVDLPVCSSIKLEPGPSVNEDENRQLLEQNPALESKDERQSKRLSRVNSSLEKKPINLPTSVSNKDKQKKLKSMKLCASPATKDSPCTQPPSFDFVPIKAEESLSIQTHSSQKNFPKCGNLIDSCNDKIPMLSNLTDSLNAAEKSPFVPKCLPRHVPLPDITNLRTRRTRLSISNSVPSPEARSVKTQKPVNNETSAVQNSAPGAVINAHVKSGFSLPDGSPQTFGCFNRKMRILPYPEVNRPVTTSISSKNVKIEKPNPSSEEGNASAFKNRHSFVNVCSKPNDSKSLMLNSAVIESSLVEPKSHTQNHRYSRCKVSSVNVPSVPSEQTPAFDFGNDSAEELVSNCDETLDPHQPSITPDDNKNTTTDTVVDFSSKINSPNLDSTIVPIDAVKPLFVFYNSSEDSVSNPINDKANNCDSESTKNNSITSPCMSLRSHKVSTKCVSFASNKDKVIANESVTSEDYFCSKSVTNNYEKSASGSKDNVISEKSGKASSEIVPQDELSESKSADDNFSQNCASQTNKASGDINLISRGIKRKEIDGDVEDDKDDETLQSSVCDKNVENSFKCEGSCLRTCFNYYKDVVCKQVIDNSESQEKKKQRIAPRKKYLQEEELQNILLKLIDPNIESWSDLVADSIKTLEDLEERSIAEGIVAFIAEDESELQTVFHPPVSSTQSLMLVFCHRLSATHPTILEAVLKTLEYNLFKLNDTPVICEVCNLATFFTLICKSLSQLHRCRAFIYDALYATVNKAHAIIYSSLSVWPRVLPLAKQSSECPLSLVISYLIFNHNMVSLLKKRKKKKEDQDLFKINALKMLLSEYYGYVNISISQTVDQVLTTLLNMLDKQGCIEAIVLLLKRENWQWSAQNVIFKRLIPMLEDYKVGKLDEPTALITVKIVGLVTRAFPVGEAWCETSRILEYLGVFLMDNKLGSPNFKEAVASSIFRLYRADENFSFSILSKWNPQSGSLSVNFLEEIKSIFYQRTLMWWQNFLISKES